MLNCKHGTCRYPSSGGDPGKPCRLRQDHSWGMDGIEGRCPPVERRRAKTGLDSPGFGADTHEPKSLDSGCECGRDRRSKKQAQTWAAVSANSSDGPGSGTSFGAISPGFWPEPGSLGWAHSGRAFKTPVRIKAESTTSSDVDASTGISLKAGQLCLPSSASERREAISPGVKKNFKIWGREKRSSSRMRRDLRSIRDWDGDGLKKDILFVFRRPANINNALIFRAGWPHFRDALGLFGRSAAIGEAS